jgi:hypothetical protein
MAPTDCMVIVNNAKKSFAMNGISKIKKKKKKNPKITLKQQYLKNNKKIITTKMGKGLLQAGTRRKDTRGPFVPVSILNNDCR